MKFFEKIPQFEKKELFPKKFLVYLSAFILSMSSVQVAAKDSHENVNDKLSKKEEREVKHEIAEIKKVYAKYEDYIKNNQTDTFSVLVGTDKKILLYHVNDGYALTLEEKGDKGKGTFDYTDGNFVSVHKNNIGHGYLIPGDGLYSFTLYDSDRDGVVNTITGRKTNNYDEVYPFNPSSDEKEELAKSYSIIMKMLGNNIDLKNQLGGKGKE
jgi:archaellum component FlaF (FlaF/FlaG flagellin family)